MRRNDISIFIAVLMAIVISPLFGEKTIYEEIQTKGSSFSVVEVVRGLDRPWGMAFLPDGGFLVTERPGKLNLVRDGKVRKISGLPEIIADGQGGLLDVALHPDYRENGYVYLSYSRRIDRGTGTAVARARLNGVKLIDFQEIFRMKAGGDTRRHFGSRLAFLPDGTLLITLGERGSMERAQDLGDHAGKTLRINDDGSIPSDNPFVGTPGVLPEIYSYGHRNAQGMVVDPSTGVIWQHEHGPKGGDEVNIVLPGRNYGWPLVTYGIDYDGTVISSSTELEGITGPEIYWVPSIAPSGFALYRGDLFPDWRGDLFTGALAGLHLRRLVIDRGKIVDQEVLLKGVLGRIRDVRTGPDGHLWILTDEKRGGVYKLVP